MPPFSSFSTRVRTSAFVFGGWLAAAFSLVAWLGAQHAHPANGSGEKEILKAVSAGWRVVHYLDLGEPAAVAVARHLATGAPQDRLGQQMVLSGSDLPVEEGLAQTGWRPSREAASPGSKGSFLSVYAPTGERQWSGRYDAEALAEPGATLLTGSLLATLARGESFPPIVPVGCRPFPPSAP